MMVAVTKSFSFPRENHVLALPCRGYSCSLLLVSEDLICSMLQKRKLPLRLRVALT